MTISAQKAKEPGLDGNAPKKIISQIQCSLSFQRLKISFDYCDQVIVLKHLKTVTLLINLLWNTWRYNTLLYRMVQKSIMFALIVQQKV